MRPTCDRCGAPLDWWLVPPVGYSGCTPCEKAKKLQVQIGEGTALVFKDEEYKTYDFLEITPEIADRCRYSGIMQQTPEGVVAVFRDLKNGRFYGQPV